MKKMERIWFLSSMGKGKDERTKQVTLEYEKERLHSSIPIKYNIFFQKK